MAEPEKYVRLAADVEVMKWGPTWEQMLVAAEWLGASGISFYFNDKKRHDPYEEYGLPELWISTAPRFDRQLVRVGDRLVKFGQGDVRVVPSKHFRDEYAPALADDALEALYRYVHGLEHSETPQADEDAE